MTCCLQLPVCSCSVTKELRERVLRGKYRIPFYMSTDCENLLKRFLVLNPTKRGTLEVIAQMRWIRKLEILCSLDFWAVTYYFHTVPMHIWALEVGLLIKAHDSSKILFTELITHLTPVTFKINVSQHFLCHKTFLGSQLVDSWINGWSTILFSTFSVVNWRYWLL